ncbi:LIN54 [Mytilus coruscus]|uniref:LIN54 n=1 Tax=Mytilus coruscus TaxID=42192 RepID=A0A6J8AIV0_MYTCO|nr:LIN54 [Mytilus coruscus]
MPAQRTGIGVVNLHENDPSAQSIEINSNNSFSGNTISVDYGQLKGHVLNPLDNLEGTLENLEPTESNLGNVDQVLVDSSDSNNHTQIQIVNSTADSGHSEGTLLRLSDGSVVSSLIDNSQIVSASSLTTASSQAVKRQLNASSSSPMVTKVIITKNPNSSQPQAVPIQLNPSSLQSLQQGQALTFNQTMAPAVSVVPQSAQTPTKTITISQQGIMSPQKQYFALPVSSPKPGITKIPISPAKTPTKITMIPVTVGKSPQRIAPASGVSVLSKSLSDSATYTAVPVSSGPTMITLSPSKVFKQGTVVQQRPGQIQFQQNQAITINKPQTQGGVRQVAIPLSSMQQIQGSKVQYVRLVAPTQQGQTAGIKTSLASLVQGKQIFTTSGAHPLTIQQAGGQQMKITLPVQSNHPRPVIASSNTQTVQRILLPAGPNQLQLRAVPSTLAQIQTSGVSSLSNLPPGTTILSSGNAGSGQGFALVPTMLSQMAQQQQQATVQVRPMTSQATVIAQPLQNRQEFIPIASNNPVLSASVANSTRNNNSEGAIEPTGARPRKPCNCTKSQCLKLYCDCFANGEFCHNCNCTNCANNLIHEEERSRAIKSCLDRNPMAFHPKIGKGQIGNGNRRHNKGCNCKRSGCLKNYCECYEAKIMCSNACKCFGCKNFEESPERRTLMHLADAAEVRVQQQTAAKTKLSSQISGVPSKPPTSTATGERLPYTFITSEVAEATCACLLAQAEESERMKMPPVVQERMVIEEFGRCLLQIIESANKTKGDDEEER